MRRALRWYFLASATMLFGMVAENSRVRRSSGVGVEDEFEILAKAHVEHLVGFVEHDDGEARRSSAPRSIWSRSRPGVPTTICAPGLQRAALRARVHAADAGDDARAGMCVEPVQLARDLQRQFARRRDDEAERRAVSRHRFRRRPSDRRHGEAEGHGLAGAGLGRDENVAALGLGLQHGGLDGGRASVITLRERAGQRGAGVFKGQCLADRLEVLAWLIARGVGKRLMESCSWPLRV